MTEQELIDTLNEWDRQTEEEIATINAEGYEWAIVNGYY